MKVKLYITCMCVATNLLLFATAEALVQYHNSFNAIAKLLFSTPVTAC